MTEYISLGGNCAIAYQLHNYGLRKQSHIFDWARSSISQLLMALEDGCKEYVDSMEISDFSDNHPYIKLYKSSDDVFSQSGTYKCKNKYGILISHELVKSTDFSTLKEKLSNRLLRLYTVSDNISVIQLVFIRLETKIISIQSYSKNLIKLLDILNVICKTKPYTLKLILHSCNSNISELLYTYIINKQLEVYYYNNFSHDWKMNNINWDKIF